MCEWKVEGDGESGRGMGWGCQALAIRLEQKKIDCVGCLVCCKQKVINDIEHAFQKSCPASDSRLQVVTIKRPCPTTIK